MPKNRYSLEEIEKSTGVCMFVYVCMHVCVIVCVCVCVVRSVNVFFFFIYDLMPYSCFYFFVNINANILDTNYWNHKLELH